MAAVPDAAPMKRLSTPALVMACLLVCYKGTLCYLMV